MSLQIGPWPCIASAALFCAGCGERDVDSRFGLVRDVPQSIAGGTIDPDTRAVYSLRVVLDEGFRQCTATRIAPNLFLTARHCLVEGSGRLPCGNDFPGVLPADSIELTNATRLDSPEALEAPTFRGVEVRVPDDDATCGADLALVLTEEVSELEPVIPPRLEPPPLPGEVYSAVGYGLLGVLAGGEGTRRRLDGVEVECAGESCGNTVTDSEFLGGGGPCEGDSGWPALVAGEDGPELLGVLSRGTADCERSVYTAVASWDVFLREEGRRAAATGGYVASSWATITNGDPSDEGGGGAPSSGSGPEEPAEPPASGSSDDSGGCTWAASRPPVAVGKLPSLLLGGFVALRATRRRRGTAFERQVATWLPRAWTASSVLLLLASCRSQPFEFRDTEERRFAALCEDGRCRYERRKDGDASGKTTVTLDSSGRLVAVCDGSDAAPPLHCRAVTCSSACPPLPDGRRLTCDGGLCVDPEREPSPTDTRLLCLAGTGLERTARQAARLALAAACTPPCRLPAGCGR